MNINFSLNNLSLSKIESLNENSSSNSSVEDVDEENDYSLSFESKLGKKYFK